MNDLLEVSLSVSLPIPPAGLEYALVRSAGDVRAWSTSGKGTELLGTSDSALLSFEGEAGRSRASVRRFLETFIMPPLVP